MEKVMYSAPVLTRLLYDMDEAAELLSMSRRQLERMAARSEVATLKIGSLRRIPAAELVRLSEGGKAD